MWLLEASIKRKIEDAHASGFAPTAEQLSTFEARFSSNSEAPGGRILSVAGSKAEIQVRGVLTKSPDFLAAFFGGGNTTYAEIITALDAIQQDDAIDEAFMRVDSPGGTVSGLFDAIAAMQSFTKPLTAIVEDTAASAAFALVSQADTVRAEGRSARVGSIGIVVTARLNENERTITSTNAPRKRPDVTTEEGVAMVVEELDALHELFVEAIAEGRGVTTSKVNAEYGQGGMFLAGEAVKRGMIDSIVESTNTNTAPSGNKSEASIMDLNKLRAEHPETYAAAVQIGTDGERDRISAHLILGEKSGDLKTAVAACKDGSEMTATLQATYMAAGMNRADISAREGDEADADAGDEADAPADINTLHEATASLVEQRLGMEDV